MTNLNLCKGLCFDQVYKNLYEKLVHLRTAEEDLNRYRSELSKKTKEHSGLKEEIAKLHCKVEEDQAKASNSRKGFFGTFVNIFNKGVGKVHQATLDSKNNQCCKLENQIPEIERKIAETETLVSDSSTLIEQLKQRRAELAQEYSPREYFEIESGVLKKCLYGAIEIAIIPDDVKIIGENAFRDMKILKVIDFNNVIFLESAAFWNCENLTHIDIAISCTEIPAWLCIRCKSLKSVTFGESVKRIDHNAFSSCSALESITIPDSVEEIGDSSFRECSSLKSVTFGKSVKRIGDYAFNNCSALESISIPKSVKEIGDYAFSDCTSLNVNFKGGSAGIKTGIAAFSGCKKVNW